MQLQLATVCIFLFMQFWYWAPRRRPRWMAIATSCRWDQYIETPSAQQVRVFAVSAVEKSQARHLLLVAVDAPSFLSFSPKVPSCKGCSSAKSFAVKACRPAFAASPKLQVYVQCSNRSQPDLLGFHWTCRWKWNKTPNRQAPLHSRIPCFTYPDWPSTNILAFRLQAVTEVWKHAENVPSQCQHSKLLEYLLMPLGKAQWRSPSNVCYLW